MCPLPPPLRLRQIRVAYSAAAPAVRLPPATGMVGLCCSSGRRLVMAVLEAAKLEECRTVPSNPPVSKAEPLCIRWLESKGFSQMSAEMLLGGMTVVDPRDAPPEQKRCPSVRLPLLLGR
ncbi:hypothetical protein MRX96_014399 [Rhipicephalus microplus]